MKKLAIPAISVFLSVLITGYLLFINHIIISVRLNELKTSLKEMDINEGNADHIGLIATYEINKKIYEKRLSQENADKIELRISTISRMNKRSTPAGLKYSIISLPALAIINFNRKILGKAYLGFRDDPDHDFVDLDIAYHHERNYLFSRAAALYEHALKTVNISNSLKASILLHQGYCYALAGLNNEARYNYQVIINKYSQENSAITAVILLQYLEGFKLEREKIMSAKSDPLSRSQDLVNLLAYEQALNILNTVENTAGARDIPRIKYFKARCFAGLGKHEKAVENYIQVITGSPSSQYAKYSNRKIFLMGSSIGGNNKILNLSIDLNSRLKDPVLSQMIKDQGDIPPVKDEIKALDFPDIPPDVLHKAEKFTADVADPERKEDFMIIVTSDGNTFRGTIIEQNEKEIVLLTSIGKINVKRDRVTSISPGK